MSLANTLSVLLNFKTDLSGLAKFTDGLTSRLQKVQELNKSLSNGAAAVNSVLQAAAGYFAVGALKDYTREAIEARTAQAKLDQALAQTKQGSAAYRAELGAQASALQQVTGIEDEVISGVQRQLVFAKAQKKDIGELTALTLDFAAAKEIDAVSAAKAVGRALQGEGDELARYGVEVNLAGDKTAALLAGLGKFKGQAATAFAALPEGMRAFKVASKEAQQAAGEAVLEISSPFLQGLASGLRSITDRFGEMRTEGSLVQDALRGVATWLGNLVGGNLDKLAMIAAALLTMKAGSYALNEGIKMLAASFLFFTGQSLPAMLAGIQSLSKEVGILQALSVGGWAAKLALGLTAIAVGMAAFAVGSAVIGSIEQAQLSRLAREEQVRGKLADQTREFSRQLAAIRSITDAQATAAAIEEQMKQAVAERDKLEGKKKIASGQSLFQGRRTFTDDDRERLAQLDQQIYDLAQRFRLATDKGFVEGQINKNVATDTKARAAQTPDQQAKAEDLDHKRAALELETAITEAQIDGNFELENRLTRERDELQLMQALKAANPDAAAYNAGVDAIRAQLDVQEELRKKAHDKALLERELFSLETQATAAEAAGNTQLAEQLREQIKLKQLNAQFDGRAAADVQARVDAERALIAQRTKLAGDERSFTESATRLAQQKSEIEANALLTDREKATQLLPIIREMIALTEARKAAIASQLAGANEETKVQLQSKIDELNATIAQLKGEATKLTTTPSLVDQQRIANKDLADPSKHYQNTGDGAQGGAISALNSLGTIGDDAAASVNDGLNAALNQTQGLLYNLASGAMSFRQAWGQAIVAVGQQFLQSTTMMVAKMIWRATIERGLTALGVTLHVGGEQAKTGATLLGGAKRLAMTAKEALADVFHGAVAAFKALASIPYVGPILGAAAMAAALIGGMALVKQIGGHQEGGIVRGGKQLSWLNEDGRNEAVLNADGLAMLGAPFVDAVNSGRFDLSTLPARLMANIERPSSAVDNANTISSGAGGRGSLAAQLLAAQSAAPAGGFNGTLIVGMGEDYLQQAMASTPGQKITVRTTARNRRAIGIRT